jgi:MFS family permease
MNTIIGLLSREKNPTMLIQKLDEAGLPEQRVKVIQQVGGVLQLLGIHPNQVMTSYVILGAGIGAAVYFTSALLAAWCECNLFGFDLLYGIEAFLGGVLAGSLIGGVIGGLVGLAKVEKDAHLYVQGVRIGGKVIAIQTENGETARLMRLLDEASLQGVKILDLT